MVLELQAIKFQNANFHTKMDLFSYFQVCRCPPELEKHNIPHLKPLICAYMENEEYGCGSSFTLAMPFCSRAFCMKNMEKPVYSARQSFLFVGTQFDKTGQLCLLFPFLVSGFSSDNSVFLKNFSMKIWILVKLKKKIIQH